MCIHRERWTCTTTPRHTHRNILYSKITKEKILRCGRFRSWGRYSHVNINTELLKPGEHTVALRNRCVSPVRTRRKPVALEQTVEGMVGNGTFKDPSVLEVRCRSGTLNCTKTTARHFNSNLRLYTDTHSWWIKTITVKNGNIKGEKENIGK